MKKLALIPILALAACSTPMTPQQQRIADAALSAAINVGSQYAEGGKLDRKQVAAALIKAAQDARTGTPPATPYAK